MAEHLRVPHLMGLLQPFSRTREFPYCGAPTIPLGGLYNRATYILTEQISWMAGRKWTNRWRETSLGLPPLPLRTPFTELYRSGEPFIYGFSEHVIPRPGDWPPTHEITGYWYLDEAESWTPPPDLLDFLASGTKPVYMGFGSMAGEVAEQMTDIAVEAVTRTRQRAILLGGWAANTERAFPDSVYVLDSAPHDWLFPQVAAVVHHGGAGTTAAGLRAGVPTVVVPFFADQPFWGRRVQSLGVGPEPLSPKRLSSLMLADAMTHVVSDSETRKRAVALGKRIRAEDGLGKAADRVLEFFRG
jgi:UDP:flavonoid glycosyltransferase YjiC (YdhE family)